MQSFTLKFTHQERGLELSPFGCGARPFDHDAVGFPGGLWEYGGSKGTGGSLAGPLPPTCAEKMFSDTPPAGSTVRSLGPGCASRRTLFRFMFLAPRRSEHRLSSSFLFTVVELAREGEATPCPSDKGPFSEESLSRAILGATALNPATWSLSVFLERKGGASHHHLAPSFQLPGETRMSGVLL